MATQQETGLEAHGIENVARVYWNLSVPALYEEAVRRREGSIADGGPLVCRTGQHTGRSPNDKFIVQEPSSERHVWWGKVNRPIDAAQFDALHERHAALPRRARALRPGLLRRRRPELSPADPRHHRAGLAQPVRAAHVHPRAERTSACATHEPEFTVIDVPGLPGRPGRHGTNSEVFILLNFAEEARADRRHQLRRGDQEVDLHRDELSAAAARRHVDALLGERRARTATSRSSSASRAPARRRSRAIPSAG